MPRDTIDLRYEVPRLGILSADGSVDEELDPGLDDDLLLRFHEEMVCARRFDQRRLKLQRAGSIGTFAPVEGQEAANLGPISVLHDDDWFVPSFREPAAMVWRGAEMAQILLYDGGYNEGAAIPDDAHDLPPCVPVASQLPHAVGIAYAAQVQQRDEVVMTFFGDGATSEGDFHEALNSAAVWKSPVVFVCQNNQWAISVPIEQQTASKTIAQKALAYGMPGIQVDGNDVLACRVAAQEAVERARAGDGPTLIECVTYRLSLHTTADDPSQYRDEEEVETWREKDPITRLQAMLRNRELLDDDAIAEVEERCDERIESAWKDAKQRMAELDAEPAAMFEHQYSEIPDYLARQRAAYLKDADAGTDDDASGGEDDDD